MPPATTATARPPATSTDSAGALTTTRPPAVSRQRTSASTVAREPPAGRAAFDPWKAASASPPAPVPGSSGDCCECAAQCASGAISRSSPKVERSTFEAEPSSVCMNGPASAPSVACASAAS